MTTMTGQFSCATRWSFQRASVSWKRGLRMRRCGTPPFTVDRRRKTLEMKEMFERKINGSIGKRLPGVDENSFR